MENKMKKHLLKLVFLLAPALTLQASELLPGGGFISGAVEERPPVEEPMPIGEPMPVEGPMPIDRPMPVDRTVPNKTPRLSELFVFEEKLKTAGQERVLKVLEGRNTKLKDLVEEIKNTRNRDLMRDHNEQELQELLAKCSNYITLLKKKLTAQQYETFIKQNSQYLFDIIEGSERFFNRPVIGYRVPPRYYGGYVPFQPYEPRYPINYDAGHDVGSSLLFLPTVAIDAGVDTVTLDQTHQTRKYLDSREDSQKNRSARSSKSTTRNSKSRQKKETAE